MMKANASGNTISIIMPMVSPKVFVVQKTLVENAASQEEYK
jgi:hypothetical protein